MVEVKITTDDDVFRDEIQNLNHAADNRHAVRDSGNDAALCINGYGCRHQFGVCFLGHNPDLFAAAVFVLGCAGCGHDCRDQLCRCHSGTIDRGDIAAVEIFPRARGYRITGRLFCLHQTGNDTQRHAGAGSIQDGLIQGKADCLSNRGENFRRQINVGIFNVRVANREISGNLPAAEFYIIENEIELIDVRAAIGPYCLRECAHNHKAAIAGHRPNEYMLV